MGNSFLGVRNGIVNLASPSQLISLDHQAPSLPFVSPSTPEPGFALPKYGVGDIVQRLDKMQGVIQGVYGRKPGKQDYMIYWKDGAKSIEFEVNLILIFDNPAT